MFNKRYQDRLFEWAKLRSRIETDVSPFEMVIVFYATAPSVSIQVDPYDPETWLGPWELIYENQYCEFSKMLAFAYTLKLTERFIDSEIEIHICTNKQKQELDYCVVVDNVVISQNSIHSSINYFKIYKPEVTYNIADFV